MAGDATAFRCGGRPRGLPAAGLGLSAVVRELAARWGRERRRHDLPDRKGWERIPVSLSVQWPTSIFLCLVRRLGGLWAAWVNFDRLDPPLGNQSDGRRTAWQDRWRTGLCVKADPRDHREFPAEGRAVGTGYAAGYRGPYRRAQARPRRNSVAAVRYPLRAPAPRLPRWACYCCDRNWYNLSLSLRSAGGTRAILLSAQRPARGWPFPAPLGPDFPRTSPGGVALAGPVVWRCPRRRGKRKLRARV